VKANAVGFSLRVVAVEGGFASQCWLEGELIGQRETFPTAAAALADQAVVEASIVADLATRGIAAVKRGGAQA